MRIEILTTDEKPTSGGCQPPPEGLRVCLEASCVTSTRRLLTHPVRFFIAIELIAVEETKMPEGKWTKQVLFFRVQRRLEAVKIRHPNVHDARRPARQCVRPGFAHHVEHGCKQAAGKILTSPNHPGIDALHLGECVVKEFNAYTLKMPFRNAVALLFASFALSVASAHQIATFTLAGDWDVRIQIPGSEVQILHVAPPLMVHVKAEKYASLPVFNPKVGGWLRGVQLQGVKAQETTSPNLLDPASFELRAGPEPNAALFTSGVDYELEAGWGTVGRLASGGIKPDQPVFASYRHAQMRLDSVVRTGNGQIVLRQGEPRAAAPSLPILKTGDQHLGNIYLPGFIAKLESDHLFPILESSYPATAANRAPTIERLMKKLNTNQPLRILAWGDSVTDGSYVKPIERWQEQFVARLRERFPKSRIELITQAWGGRNTGTYLAEPPGSPHNYRETVLAMKPDLVISEFVNDAGLDTAQVEERYAKLLADFKAIGAEWIILSPHYVRPDWMKLTREREIDDDPRPYVKGLRAFAATHDVALADASLRYGRLWRQGIPYNTLMLNAINHPDVRGMRIFADALLALFE